MELADVQSLVGRVAAVDDECADVGVVKAAVGDLRRLQSWIEGRQVAFAKMLARLSSFPEKSLAEAARTSLRRGEDLLRRAETTDAVPAMGVSLDEGRVSGEHVDVLARTLRHLQPAARQRLVDDGARLAMIAEQSTPDEFARSVRDQARRLEAASDGLERLERQRQAVRLSTWIDKMSGMGRWSATWDPATMVTLESRLDAQVDTMFHTALPEGCPTDPLEKQGYLRALALLALLDGHGARVGRPELIVVEDHTNPDPDGHPSIDWGLDVDLPREFFDDVRQRATLYSITVRNGVVINAPGVLNLGRTTRLANRAQRRALRGLYATCAIPGCHIRYNRTKLHHITWWRHHGLTDLDNLLPLCEHHHQNIHHNRWLISLGPHRELTLQLPDGQIMTTGPPNRTAA
jgi:Domain of unknown function (DUF222)